MRLEMKFIMPGMQLAQSIVAPSGRMILEQGTTLKTEYIKHLMYLGISNVHVVLPAKIDRSQLASFLLHKKTVEWVAMNFETMRIFKEFSIDDLTESDRIYRELIMDTVGVADILSRLRVYNEYLFGHILNVANLSGLIGKWLGYTGETLKDLILAGLLHDIGKIFIPLEILNKPGKLTVSQMDVVKHHSSRGYDFLKERPEISDAVKFGVLQHHERFDGSGYPFGLCEDKISVFARIIAIADMYDAMTSERVYRPGMPPFAAADIIAVDVRDKLDPAIGRLFLARIRDYFTG